jgi:subtilisin family serine protease
VAIFIANRLHEPNNQDNMINLYLAADTPAGPWQVKLHSRGNQAVHYHAWIERRDQHQSAFAKSPDNAYTLGSISCGHETIAVASFDAHQSGRRISTFSSEGPTRDGRQKPELSAPGDGVVAACSRTGNGTTVMSGTSMAAPAVTGLVALLLAEAQRRGKKLSSAEIRKALFDSARRDPPRLKPGQWDSRYGFGRAHIGALALLPK